MNILDFTIKQLHQQLVKKEISATELSDFYLSRIKEYEPKLHAFINVVEELARKKAGEIDRKISSGEIQPPQPLLSNGGSYPPPRQITGIPASIKDVIVTKDIVSTGGSKILENYAPPYDATVIQKLKTHDYVLLGKNNCDEFAQGSSTENSGFGPAKNPWDLSRVSGGSSGGSAAAVAAGLTHYSLGSDTGGSVRQPSSFCGVVGIKPTYGRVSRYGLMAMASSLDQIGVIARRVEDVEDILKVIEGEDCLDSTSASCHPGGSPDGIGTTDRVLDSIGLTTDASSQTLQNDSLKGLKIGVPKEYFSQGLDKEVEKLIKRSIDQLKELGAEIKKISLPNFEYALATYYIIMPAEVSSNMARYDSIRYGVSQVQSSKLKAQNLEDLYKINRSGLLGEEVKRRIMLGTYVLSAGYYEQYYGKAQSIRKLIREDFVRAFEKVDIIAGPVAPTPAFKLGEKTEDPLQMYLSDIYTVPVNLAGLPALSVPAGFASIDDNNPSQPTLNKGGRGNLPVGLHLIGKWWEDYKLLQVAEVFERVTEYYKVKPRL